MIGTGAKILALALIVGLRPLPGLDRVVICCAGDSLMRPVPGHLRELWRRPKTQAVIKDWSQGGLSSRTYQGFFRRQSAAWHKTSPDLILIQLGTNDAGPILLGKYDLAEFRKNLRAIVDRFRQFRSSKNQPPRIFIASIPYFSGTADKEGKNRVIRDGINPAIKDLAVSEGLVFVDNFAVMNEKPTLYDADGVHPSSEGETALAGNWLSWIERELNP